MRFALYLLVELVILMLQRGLQLLGVGLQGEESGQERACLHSDGDLRPLLRPS